MATAANVDLPEAFETERLLLRAPRPGDGAAINEAILETWDELHRWLPWAREKPSVEQSEEAVRLMAAGFQSRTDLPLTIWLRDGGGFLGGTGLHRMDWGVPRFEIGYWLRASAWGKGYCAEAVRAVARIAFATLGAQRVEIHCSHGNARSRKVAEQCGFVLQGQLRDQAREYTGELGDALVYALGPADPVARALLG